jgi:hypothetical protein
MEVLCSSEIQLLSCQSARCHHSEDDSVRSVAPEASDDTAPSGRHAVGFEQKRA